MAGSIGAVHHNQIRHERIKEPVVYRIALLLVIFPRDRARLLPQFYAEPDGVVPSSSPDFPFIIWAPTSSEANSG